MVNVGATDPEIDFLTDNTRQKGGQDVLIDQASDANFYGIQGANFEDYHIWSVAAGNAATEID